MSERFEPDSGTCTLPSTIMEVDNGLLAHYFPLPTEDCPLPCLFQGVYILGLGHANIDCFSVGGGSPSPPWKYTCDVSTVVLMVLCAGRPGTYCSCLAPICLKVYLLVVSSCY